MELQRRIGYHKWLCRGFTLSNLLCTITPPDRGIPFSQNRGIPNKSLCYVTNWEFPRENVKSIVSYYALSGAIKLHFKSFLLLLIFSLACKEFNIIVKNKSIAIESMC